jgi:hypothetical protein
MNHNPFETWLFSDEVLSPEDQEKLHHHLEDCEYCRQLNEGRNGVERQLRHPLIVSPLPGFSTRWQLRLELERKRAHRKQSLTLLSLSLGSAFVFIVGLFIYYLPILRIPRLYLWTYIYQLLTFSNVINYFENTIRAWYLALDEAFSISWVAVITPLFGVTLVSFLSVLALGWFLSIRKLTMPKQEVIEVNKYH